MTFQRRTALRDRRARPRAHARRRRSSSAATIRASRRRRTRTRRRRRLHRARRRGASRSASCCARSKRGARLSPRSPGLSYRDGRRGFRHNAARGRSARSTDGESGLPEPRRPRARRLHLPRPADRHRRDLARLHLRLQLLLDHRDARPQLPHLRLRAGARRHRATRATAARARSSSSTTTSR